MNIKHIYKRLLGYKPFAFGYVKNYGERNEKVQKAELLCYALNGLVDREQIYRYDFSPIGIDATISVLNSKLKNAMPILTDKSRLFDGCKMPWEFSERAYKSFPLCSHIEYPLEIYTDNPPMMSTLEKHGFVKKNNSKIIYTFVGACQK